MSKLPFWQVLVFLRTTSEQRAAEKRKARHIEHMAIVERRRAKRNAKRKQYQ